MGPGFAFLTSEYGGRDVGGMGVSGRRADQGDTEVEAGAICLWFLDNLDAGHPRRLLNP